MTSDAINTNNNNKDFHQDNEQNLSSVDNEQQAGEALSFDKQIDFNRGSKLSEEIFKKDASNQDKTFQAILDNLGESRNNSNINNLIKENVSSNGQNNQKDNANQNENSQQNQQQNSDSDQQNLERNVSANFEDKQNIEQIKFQRQERVEEQNLLKSQNLSQLGSEIQYQENNSQMLSSSFLQQVNQDFVLEKSQIQDLSNPDEQIKPNKFLTKEEIQILKEDFDVTHETQQQKALSQVNNYVSGQIQQDQQRESQLIQDQQREQLLVPSKKENDENKQSNNEGKVNENPIKESQIQNDMKYLNQEQSQNQELNDTLLKSFNQEVIEQNQIIQEEISSSKLMNNNFEFDRNFGQEEPRKDIEKGQLYLIKENISVTKDSVSQLQSVQFQDQIRQDSFNQTNQIHQIQDQQKDFKKNQIDKNDVSVTFEQNTSAQQQSENRQTDLGVEKKLQKDFKINQVEKDNVSVTFEQNTSVEQLNQNRQTDLDSQKQNLLESEQKSQEKKQESENNEIQHSIQDSNPKMNFTNDQMPQNELQNNSELFTQEIQDSVQDKYGQQHEVEIIKENDENQSHQVISSDQSYLNNQEFGQQQTQYRFEEISEQISQKYQGQDDDSEEN